ncbi:CAPNN [Lepeophtheirus salmonis]|uniref:CAPNN n=1 Tax=Lepeophtheirus salmonis TaxID=72036 RepID=A0A7R8H2L0_LEPSM|nr:CAPNN [Lepeophtheirus salmonis]CAF2816826.1 CAPNN [Lepeophtheirus salmonis]
MNQTLQSRTQRTNFQFLKRQCRDRGELFNDNEFISSIKSINNLCKTINYPIVWMRPHEICSNPKFIAEGVTQFDVNQGEYGDPWLLAAISSLTLTPKFLDRVVPPDQNFDYGYCGVFRFRFWQFGDWVEVLIDDRLPTSKGKLIFLHSSDPSEFWAALLEKAYAKLYGRYEALIYGITSKTLQDLTGGIVQSFPLNGHDKFLTFQVLNSAVPRSTLLIASIKIDQNNPNCLYGRQGLIPSHVYSITGLARIHGGESYLVRLKNPYGKGEWIGPWSKESKEWEKLGERDKELLSIRIQNEGEFWISFDDFIYEFSQLDLVHIGPDDWMSETALHNKKPWRAVLARRRWRSGYNAGGSPAYPETTALNPQFHIQIPRTPNKCHVVVSVTQQYNNNTTSVAREVVTFFTLPPGDFIIVPQTNVPNCDGKFLLRILTDEQSNIWEVNEDNVLFRNVFSEFESNTEFNQNSFLINKLIAKYPHDIDATILYKALRNNWKTYLLERPSLELCKSLVMLRDFNISGRLNMTEIPAIFHLLQFWKSAFLKFILWEAGVTVSNKVLECLILRFVKNKIISSESYMTVMVRLHLAHERYHSIDTKMKGNPLSLEEVILMTIYS